MAESAKKATDAYDAFLGMLNDNGKRDRLAEAKDIERDPDFQEGRELSHQFRDALRLLFFESHPELTRLTQEYGVF